MFSRYKVFILARKSVVFFLLQTLGDTKQAQGTAFQLCNLKNTLMINCLMFIHCSCWPKRRHTFIQHCKKGLAIFLYTAGMSLIKCDIPAGVGK
jgi:hypothetical protein